HAGLLQRRRRRHALRPPVPAPAGRCRRRGQRPSPGGADTAAEPGHSRSQTRRPGASTRKSSRRMSEFDIAWFAILARGLAAACFVGGVIWLMERTSPFIGGIVLALPIVTAPAYLFLVLLHPPAFVARAALASIATIGAGLLSLVTVIALVRRWPMPAALACALAVWCLTGLLTRAMPAGFASSLLILAAAGAIAWYCGRHVSLTAPAARGRSPVYE